MDHSQPTRLISVRDPAQAREWALALLSQGIESGLVEDELSGVVALEVAADQCGIALRILKQYHLENRGWGLQRELPVVHLAFNWSCLGWAGLIVLIHFLATLPGSRLVEAGLLSPAVFADGAWWRLFTAMTLHGDLGHLASNLVTGILLLGLTMARYGSGPGLLAPWLAGALANLMALFIYGAGYQSLGASGMVLAALGVLTASGMGEVFRHRPGWKPLLATMSAGLMLFVLTGSNPTSDLVVHLGGFVSGLGLGGVMEVRRSNRRPAWWGLACLVLYVAGTATTWLLALAR